MKLARYLHGDGEFWGAIDPDIGEIRRIRGAFPDWAPAVTAGGPAALEFEGTMDLVADVKLLAPLHATGHVYWIGLNYPNWPKPETADSPVFFKARSAIAHPGDTIRFPRLIRIQPQAYFAYEIELVAVIGRSIEVGGNGLSDVLGYTIGNSGALRHNKSSVVGADLLGRSSAASSSAIGPWIATRDEFGDDQPDLAMTLKINGEDRQAGRTSRMIWGMNRLIDEVNIRSRLVCGDVIETGTCGYVGVQDGVYQPGDVAEAEIEGIGVLRNPVEDTDTSPIWPGQRGAGPRQVPPIYPLPVPEGALR